MRAWGEEGAPRWNVAVAGTLNDLRFPADGRWLGIADRELRLVELAGVGRTEVLRAEGNHGVIRFSGDARSILTIDGKGRVLLIDRASRKEQVVHCCSSIWGDVEFGPGETSVIWAGHWPGLAGLRAPGEVERLTREREEMTFGPIAVDAARDRVFLGSQDGRVHQWRWSTRERLASSPGLSGYVRTVSLAGDSGWIGYSAEDGPVHLWNPETREHRVLEQARATSNLVWVRARESMAWGTELGHVETWK